MPDSDKIRVWGVEQKQFLDEFAITLPPSRSYRSLSCNRDMTRLFVEKIYGVWGCRYAIYDCSSLPKIEYLQDIELPDRSYVMDISTDGKHILFESYDDKIIRILDLETMHCIFIHNIKQHTHGEKSQLFFVDEGRKIVVINQTDSYPDISDMHVVSVNTGKILATRERMLREMPRYHAVHKDQFLLGSHYEGIRLFSCTSLIKEEESLLSNSTEQQFSPR